MTMISLASRLRPLVVGAVLSVLFLSGCPDPNEVLHVDKFNLQFSRRAVVVEVDGVPHYRPTRDGEGADRPPQKRVTVSNSSSAEIPLWIRIEGPQAAAFRVYDTPEFVLDEPFNYKIDANGRLEITIQFVGAGGLIGPNLARIMIDGGEELEDGWSYHKEVILQGDTDCISMGLDADEDGYCDTDSLLAVGADASAGDCDDGTYEVNPGQEEQCDEGDQLDNDCDGSATNVFDLDGDGWCNLELSCAADLQDLAAFCGFVEDELLPHDPDDLEFGGRDNDCDDADGAMYPTAPEVCELGGVDDQRDNNCTHEDDLQFLVPYWPDFDNDGYGKELTPLLDEFGEPVLDVNEDLIMVLVEPDYRCGAPPTGKADQAGDCNDFNPAVFDGADEICDGLDNDCDGCQGTGANALPVDCLGSGPSEVADDHDVDLDGRPQCADTAEGDPLDCDDDNPDTYRGAAELCDGQDNDCIDGVPEVEIDHDGDDYAECAAETVAFGPPWQLEADCDDDDPTINPGMAEIACDYVDNDCNGLFHQDETDADIDLQDECGTPGVDWDCDDSNPTVYTGAPELCDALDNDCDLLAVATLLGAGGEHYDIDGDGIPNLVDEDMDGDGFDNAVDPDIDGDGVGNAADLDDNGDGLPDDEEDPDNDGFVACDEEDPWPSGYWGIVGFSGGSDCQNDPTDAFYGPHAANIYPGAPEISDSYSLWDSIAGQWDRVLVDNQCPGDAGYDTDGNPYTDTGDDEYCFDETLSAFPCLEGDACYVCTGSELDEDEDGYTEAQGDCDDDDPERAPWLVEICDQVDNDCDGTVPPSEVDDDGDGFIECWPVPGVTAVVGGDCDDGAIGVNPAADELFGNSIDDDCDSTTVDMPGGVDDDGDGVTVDGGDCDDADPTVYTGADELCDGLDNDCDGLLGDGVLLQPDGVTLQPDELDDDLDGYTKCGDQDCIDSADELYDEFSAWLASLGTPGSYPGSLANAEAAATSIHPQGHEVCDGWDNDCTGQAAFPFLPFDDLSGGPTDTLLDEFDDDGDGYVECNDVTYVDPLAAGAPPTGWVTWADQANVFLLGGFDCGDTTNQTDGISYSGDPLEPMASIYPGAWDSCDGWDNPCGGADLSDRPHVQPESDEWDDDLDRYIECFPWVNTGQVNTNGLTILGGGDCLDEEQNHVHTGDPLTYALAAMINPGVTEVCDGFDTDCSQEDTGDALYDATEVNSALDEDDTDFDFWIQCDEAPNPSLVPGYFGDNDCLDDATLNPKTGDVMLTSTVGQYVNPAAAEVCDGLNTDCTADLSGVVDWDADDENSILEEDDHDGDEWLECQNAAGNQEDPSAWLAAVGFQNTAADWDCLDEDTVNPKTASHLMTGALVGFYVHPGASELCDGLNTDCSLDSSSVRHWQASDSNSSVEEDDADGDEYLECLIANNPSVRANPSAWVADVGYENTNADFDCLDETTVHFDTGQTMTAVAVGQFVNPAMTEICDGLDTDCSQQDTGDTYYDATVANAGLLENDTDHDFYLECGASTDTVASYITLVGYGTDDCLDETTVHFETGDTMSPAGVGYYVHPNDPAISWDVNTTEVCDGLNTDCSGTLATNIYDATDANSILEEDDNDLDGWLECLDGATRVDPASWVTEVGFANLAGDFDCLDEETPNTRTSTTMTATDVGFYVHPLANEVCDGLNTDCGDDGVWQASDSNSTLEEDDADDDGYLECLNAFNNRINPASWLVDVGYFNTNTEFDCLDEATAHFATGAAMGLTVAEEVHPGASEVCDGLNTDCSLPVAAGPNFYDAQDGNTALEEDDTDGDKFLECLNTSNARVNPASWVTAVGFLNTNTQFDCLDETTTHFATGANMQASVVGVQVHPGAAEVCDGLNTNCDGALAGDVNVDGQLDDYDATDANSTLEEDDADDDTWLECLNASNNPVAPAAWVSAAGFGNSVDVFDCLDEATTDPERGSLTLALAALINPAASEVCDGFNTNCSQPVGTPYYDPIDATDEPNPTDTNTNVLEGDHDGDHWIACELVAATTPPSYDDVDCRDERSDIHPGRTDGVDVATNPEDNDCDGVFDEEDLALGDVVVTEMDVYPFGDQASYEWFEIWNLTAATVNLRDWIFTDDGSNTWTVPGDLEVLTGDRAVLCSQPDTIDPGDLDGLCDNLDPITGDEWVWDQSLTNFVLQNSADEIIVTAPCAGGAVAPCNPADGDPLAGALLLDEVAWDSAWGLSVSGNRGLSFGLDPDGTVVVDPEADNDSSSNWCFAVAPSGLLPTDYGTPGATNSSCVADLQDNDLDGYCEGGVDDNGDGDCDDAGEAAAENTAECVGSICDCLDDNPWVAPDLAEICDGFDTDCSEGLSNDATPEDLDEQDNDNDTFVECAGYTHHGAVNGLGNELEGSNDCNDGDAAINPEAAEIAGDEVDQDCDTDEICYVDFDDDGYRLTSTIPSTNISCADSGEGVVGDPTGDCDDSDSGDWPGAPETVDNGDDESCDGQELCYVDSDDDNWRLTSTLSSADLDCTDPGEAEASDPTLDCDDSDPGDYPGAPETIDNGDDEDCDTKETCYVDADDDNWRLATTLLSNDMDCTDPGEGRASDPTLDCDDSDPGDYPTATEIVDNGDDEDCDGLELCYVDSDNDGYRLTSTMTSANLLCTDPGEAEASDPTLDCDDSDPNDYPTATETVGNNDDEDCDGQELCFNDFDNDGWRLTSTLVSVNTVCTDPGEAVATDPTLDCNDSNAAINPAATEIPGDEVDQNCDTDELCYVDWDNDTYRLSSTVLSPNLSCNQSGEAEDGDPTNDCNDAVAAINPAAAEIAGDEVDQNCDSNELCFVDADNDGWRLTTTVFSSNLSCNQSGEAEDGEPTNECDDTDPLINGGAAEIPGDEVDQNCDTDELCYVDWDNDGWRLTTTVTSNNLSCTDNHEGVTGDFVGDCDDTDPLINGGAGEIAGDEVDGDCDGTELCYVDADNDGYRLETTIVSSNISCAQSGEALATDPTGDCDDSDPGDYDGAPETPGNGDDESCDGTEICYVNADNDSHRLTSTLVSSDTDCDDLGEALSSVPTLDCDDSDPNDYPGAFETVGNGDDENCDGQETCYVNGDGDGYRLNTTLTSLDPDCSDAGEALSSLPTLDCDDSDPNDYPSAPETVGNGDDENCDGQETCYVNVDGDGYRLTSTVLSLDPDCADAGEALSSLPTLDCDDSDPNDYPGAFETVGNGDDEDCDGQEICYVNVDGDGYRLNTTTTSSDPDCSDAGEALSSLPTLDCDDSDLNDYPGAPETVGNGDDENCDGQEICYDNTDGDGYRLTSTNTSSDSDCSDAGEALATLPTLDCDDNDAGDYPGAPETVDNGDDEDCNGADEITCYDDADGDTWGSTANGTDVNGLCNTAGLEDRTGDCNDGVAGVNPGVDLPQSPGSTTLVEACTDADHDGYCIGGGVDGNADWDCQDAGEDLGSHYSSPGDEAGDCNETVLFSADAETVFNLLDDDTTPDGLIDEGCFSGDSGEVVIVEYFSDARGTPLEPDWFEVVNVGWHAVDLDGWQVQNDLASTSFTLATTLAPLQPGDRIVLCDTAPTGVTCLDTWSGSGFGLANLDGGTSNGSQEIELVIPETGGVVVNVVDFSSSSWDVGTNTTTSYQLDEDELTGSLPGSVDNDNVANWCLTTTGDTWSAGTASPGVVNDGCP
jgi:hypothetical protein